MGQSPSRRTRYIFYGEKMSDIESPQNSQKISQLILCYVLSHSLQCKIIIVVMCHETIVTRAKNYWCFRLQRHFSRSRSSYFCVLCSEVQTDCLTFCVHQFLSKHVDLYVGIICHVHNGSKSSQWAKVNSNLYQNAKQVHFGKILPSQRWSYELCPISM